MIAIDDSVAVGLIARILGKYREMPGLALTIDQARRVWGCNAIPAAGQPSSSPLEARSDGCVRTAFTCLVQQSAPSSGESPTIGAHDLFRRREPDDLFRALCSFVLRLHRQFRISGMSSPCLAMYCLCSMSLSRIACWA